ncbi:High affinity cAMP-specific and IBMX-insensitive 3' 5'-cyclic phosphodiesterase 8A, partial [Bienertia sinuspersici]
PELVSGFHIAVVFEGEIKEVATIGDSKRACIWESILHNKNRFRRKIKWKFRGSERIEVDGYPIQLSWDVCTFRFEKQGNESMQLQECFDDDNNGGNNTPKKGKKMKNKLLVKTRSSSSSSISSASSGSSFVLEWESVEENELKGLNGFSL